LRAPFFFAFILLCTAGAQAGSALPGILGQDNRVIEESNRWPFTAIGRLNKAGTGFCTATLIAPDTAATAAHCLWNPRTRRPHRPEFLTFELGLSRGDRGRVVAIEATETQGCWSFADLAAGKDDMGCDIALLRLKTPVTAVEPVEMLRGAGEAKRGIPLTMAGYQQDRPYMLSADTACRLVGHLPKSGAIVHSCDATHGASGSPLLAIAEDRTIMIGVNVGTARLTQANGDSEILGIGAAWKEKDVDRRAKSTQGGSVPVRADMSMQGQ
jgi:protease YdgD